MAFYTTTRVSFLMLLRTGLSVSGGILAGRKTII